MSDREWPFPKPVEQPSVLNARDIVDYRKRLGRLPNVPNLKGVLLCLERGLPERMKWKAPIHLVGKMMGELYGVKRTQDQVAVMTNFGGGSPIVAELAEEFAAMGAQKLILMTWGGGLQAGQKAGDLVVCTQAIRDEGTSLHYLPPAKTILSDAQLSAALAKRIQKAGLPASLGTTWTTDAPYRETADEIRQYQADGVKTVEMEAAGLFTIGCVRKIQTSAIVVVMDDLSSLQWQAPARLDAIHRSLEIAYMAAIETLAAL